MIRTVLFASLFAVPLVGAALPAVAQDQMAMMSTMAANQKGLMQYCQDQGYVGADAVAAQQQAMAMQPAPTVPTADAEAAGKAGNLVMPNHPPMSMATMAKDHGMTVEAQCKQMGSAAIQVMSAMRQNGMGGAPGAMPGAMPGMGGMPAMPSMNGMPAMPSMPSMPGMPGMPGAPPSR